MRDEKQYEAVGNIRIKEERKKKNSKKKGSELSLGFKIFIWIMFIAMLASFIGPLAYYIITIISGS